MDEISIAVTESFGEDVLLDASKICEELFQIFDIMDEYFEKFKDNLVERIMSFLQEFASCLLTFRDERESRRKAAFVTLSLYRWSVLRLTLLPLAQSFDGISKMLRHIYLIHHQRIISATDDSALCNIA